MSTKRQNTNDLFVDRYGEKIREARETSLKIQQLKDEIRRMPENDPNLPSKKNELSSSTAYYRSLREYIDINRSKFRELLADEERDADEGHRSRGTYTRAR